MLGMKSDNSVIRTVDSTAGGLSVACTSSPSRGNERRGVFPRNDLPLQLVDFQEKKVGMILTLNLCKLVVRTMIVNVFCS